MNAGMVSRSFVDSGPVLEREIAQRAGLGWIGKHSNLINWEKGSWFFLAELLVDFPLEANLPFTRVDCGTCTICIEACPTEAIIADRTVDARRCISYLTIELKGAIPLELRPKMGNLIFGCDICQEVCPWNKEAPKSPESKLLPRPENVAPELTELMKLDQSAFSERFRNSPIKRTKRRGLLRNVAIALGNWAHESAIPALSDGLQDPEPLIRSHAAWALGRISASQAKIKLKAAKKVEKTDGVLGVYTGSRELLEQAMKTLKRQGSGKHRFREFANTREPIGEALGITSVTEICRAIRVKTVLRQTCTARGFEIARTARQDDPSLPLAVEVTPHHLHLTSRLLDSINGFAHMIPPLRTPQDCQAAVSALADGTVDFVGSDHAPHEETLKAGTDPWSVPGGVPGLDTIVPAVLDLAAKGSISYGDVVRVLCERPAEIFGVSDRKGFLKPGADGDVVLVDPEIERKIERRDIISKAGRSPFEGYPLRGKMVASFLSLVKRPWALLSVVQSLKTGFSSLLVTRSLNLPVHRFGAQRTVMR